jgi:hypothetical protein
MAVVVPLFRPHAIAAGFRYEVAAIALAASRMMAGIRLTGVELGETGKLSVGLGEPAGDTRSVWPLVICTMLPAMLRGSEWANTGNETDRLIKPRRRVRPPVRGRARRR